MAPVLNTHDIYSADRAGDLNPVVKDFPARIYVPNTESNSVDVIDPHTYKVIDELDVGHQPQHVTPSYDMKTLWVLNDKSSTLTRIDPVTGKEAGTIPVMDPYNMYYTPDGKYAIVVAEQRERLEFYDAKTMKLAHQLWVPCRGVDHMDFSANGRYLVASCEFNNSVIKVDVPSQKLLGRLELSPQGKPQDVKLSPDGTVCYVADMDADGVHLIDGETMSEIGFIPHRKGGARALREPRFEDDVCDESRRGLDFADRPGKPEGHAKVEASGRRQSGYGRRLGGRQGALAYGAL